MANQRKGAYMPTTPAEGAPSTPAIPSGISLTPSDVRTTAPRQVDWEAEYWKGVRDYIEQNNNLIEAHWRIIELTNELIECRKILAGKRTINHQQGGTNKIN